MSQALQKVVQRNFGKGVVASAQPYLQPKGSFPRGSNLVFTTRGGLKTCDGTQIISALLGTLQTPGNNQIGAIIDIFFFQPAGGTSQYYLMAKDPANQLPIVTGLTASAGGAGVLNGAYYYVVTALDGAGGETVASAEVVITVFNTTVVLNWNPVTFAVGYNVYRRLGLTSDQFMGTVMGATTYTDNASFPAANAPAPPQTNTTQTTAFYQVPLSNYSSIIHYFPADPFQGDGSSGGTGGGGGGRGGGGGTGGGQGGGTSGGSSAGGIAGNISPIPQIIQFTDASKNGGAGADVMILAVGNGYPPYESDGTFAGTTALTNTFQVAYPIWVAAQPEVVGDLMANAGTLYKCTQAGQTGSSPPTFKPTLGQQTGDGSVIWTSQGLVPTTPAPVGAAHAIVYGGSLWLFNTSPMNTSNGYDGPSCLKMSDLNNPNSWNPLNVAFLDKDDGSQGMGLATFTIAEAGIAPTGSLVAFKEFSTFQILGIFGASDFSIQRAQTDMGCMAPRTIQFIPGFGIARMSHLGVAVFDGVRDRLISEEIRPYLFGGIDIPPLDWNYMYFSKGAQVAEPPMYSIAVPTLQTIPTSSNWGATLGFTTIPGTINLIPPGTYYGFLLAVLPNGQVLRGPESGAITLSGVYDAFSLNFPAGFNANEVYRYVLYFGTTPGGENQYINFSPAAMITNAINTPIPSSGVPGQYLTSFGILNRILSYDLVLKAWTVIDLPFGISALRQFRTPGSIPVTVMGGYSDGAIRRWQAGDVNWDDGSINAGASTHVVAASMRSANVFGKSATDRVFFRRISIRGTGNPLGLQATFTANGILGSQKTTKNFTVQPMGGNEFVAYATVGTTALDVYVKLSWTGQLEVHEIDWSYVPKPVGAKVLAG